LRRRKPRALDLFCCAGGATKGLQEAGFHVTGVDLKAQPHYIGDRFYQGDALDFPIEGFDFVWASPPCQAFTSLRFMPTAKEHPNLIPQTREKLVRAQVPYCIENVEGAPLGASGYLILLCGTMFGLQTKDGRAELRRHRLFETSFSIALRPACQHGGGSVGSLSIAGDYAEVNANRKHCLTVCGHTPVDNRRGAIGVYGNSPKMDSRRTVISVIGHSSPGMSGSAKRHAISVTGTGMGDRVSKRRAITVTGATAQTNLVNNRIRETFTVQQAREAMGIDWMPMSKLSQAIPPAYSRFIGLEAMKLLKSLQSSPTLRASG
jgi:DNA (cytosine-5)-methyltransferase 1